MPQHVPVVRRQPGFDGALFKVLLPHTATCDELPCVDGM